MAAIDITVGKRTYIPFAKDFGNIERPSFLGLVNAPVLTMDDGTLIGLAGQNVLTELVPTDTKTNFLNEPVDVPLDVKVVGTQTLTEMGIAADVQATMFTNWRTKLTDAQRTDYTNQWMQASAGTPDQQKAFVDGMISELSAM